jgi:hypothetical protein
MRIGSPSTLLALSLITPVAAVSVTQAGVDIDGQLTEAEWQSAERFDQFLTADPLSLEQPAHRTEARVLAQPGGLYIGITSQVPRALRTYGQSPRDARVLDADSVRIVVDFEGSGKAAYEFTVSLSNSHRDGIFLDQTRVSYDWDGAWQHAVSEDDDNWYLEVFLPWSLATMSGAATATDEAGPTRPIGIWFLRNIKTLNRGFGYPAIEPTRPTFVADLHRMQVPSYAVQVFDWFPYAAGAHDLLSDDSEMRGGLDLFWKPDAQKQVSLTLNPDFGQVESDDLVVNFSAIETFFSEKRPFFTEGQSLFDLRTTNEGRFINTRRIGAAPDAGVEGVTDILGALKFTGLSNQLEYGAFAAMEDDSQLADGRTFAAGRLRYKLDAATVGILSTFVDRPTLDRRAQVHVLDANWTQVAGLSVTGQVVGTQVDTLVPVTGRGENGAGTVLTASYSPGGRLQQDLNLTWFDRNFDINDLGYMQRGNLRELQTITHLHTRQFAADSLFSAAYWRLNSRLRTNDYDDRLPATLELGHYWRFRRPAGVFLYYFGQTSGVDDLITRGNGLVRLPPRHEVGVQYQQDVNRQFNFTAEGFAVQEGLDDTAWRVTFRPTYVVAENLNLGLELDYTDSPDWLIWRSAAQRLATHERQQLFALFKLSWYPAQRHELRIKAQWVALRARVLQGYSVAPGGNLVEDGTPIDDLSLGQVGVQVRYRYELQPLSDLYVVYSRGGLDSRDTYADGLSELFSDATDQETASMILVKLRYRF